MLEAARRGLSGNSGFHVPIPDQHPPHCSLLRPERTLQDPDWALQPCRKLLACISNDLRLQPAFSFIIIIDFIIVIMILIVIVIDITIMIIVITISTLLNQPGSMSVARAEYVPTVRLIQYLPSGCLTS